MILVDTSVWVDHLRQGDRTLMAMLEAGQVLMHSFVLGELACGNLQNRTEVLDLLGRIPSAPMATDPEVRSFIDLQSLMGRGIGYVDVHLLASTALARDARFWTRDKRLVKAAARLDLDYSDAPK